MTRVKICGITRPEDARMAALAGADAIGMIFAPSPRRITPTQARKIIRELPSYILRVGVFVDQDPAWIRQLCGRLGLDRLQFHGRESRRVMQQFPASCVWKALRPQMQDPLPQRDPAPFASAILIDGYKPGVAGGTGTLANWQYAQALRRLGKSVILAGGLNPENVGRAVRKIRPEMVDVVSGVEQTPGIKSPKLVREFIRAAKTA